MSQICDIHVLHAVIILYIQTVQTMYTVVRNLYMQKNTITFASTYQIVYML